MTTYLQNKVESVAGQIQNQEKSAHDIISVQTDNSTSNLASSRATERTANLYLQNINSCNTYPADPPHTNPRAKYVSLYNFSAK